MPAVTKRFSNVFAVNDALNKYWGGGEILFVGNRTGLPSGDGSSWNYPLATLALALAKLQGTTGRGHVIFVLPGHAESVSSADYFYGTDTANSFTIVGLGKGASRPTLTWTTATSTWLIDTANVQIDNMILKLEPTTGTVNVAAPITISAAGCGIRNCRIACGTDANNKVTIGITTTAAADDFVFEDNDVFGAALATCTTFLRIVGGARARIRRNYITAGTTAAAVGVIQNLTTAATNALISDNVLHNSAASSTACITFALASSTGTIEYNRCRNMTDGSNAQIVVTSGDMQLFENRGVNNSNENGISIGTNSV
jgi:hypothetical protein